MINKATNTSGHFTDATVGEIRGLADPEAKIMAAFGGWGQDEEFGINAATGSMETIAENMMLFVERTGM